MIQKDKLAQFYFTQYRDGTGKYKKKNQDGKNIYAKRAKSLSMELQRIRSGHVKEAKLEDYHRQVRNICYYAFRENNQITIMQIRDFLLPELVRLDMAAMKPAEQEVVTERFLTYLREEMPYEICVKTLKDLCTSYAEYGIRSQIIDLVPLKPETEFPKAREMDRHFILHIGPTNCGKTYHALQRLKEAQNGVYLGPLRLLALEVYEKMTDDDIPCTMLTGEECIYQEDSRIVSSTIEMLDAEQAYDIAVIDEAQMIADPDRGHSWTRAILGVQAKEIHICMSPAGEKVIRHLITMCGDTMEEHRYERKTPLIYEDHSFIFPDDVRDGDALIVFTKRAVLDIAGRLEDEGIKTSVVYGSLPPEIRRRQIHLFAQKETSVVVSTDAIGMGLNLPVRRIVFLQTDKFDGKEKRRLTVPEIRQIAGRAGRFGMYDTGYVSACGEEEWRYVKERYCVEETPIDKVSLGFPTVLLNMDEPLNTILTVWKSVEPEEPFEKISIEEMLYLYERAYKERKDIDGFEDKHILYRMLTCSIDIKNRDIVSLWLEYCKTYTADVMLFFPTLGICNDRGLMRYETYYKMLDLYHQFSNRLGKEMDVKRLEAAREKTELNIMQALAKNKKEYINTCKYCGRTLPFGYEFRVCDTCYMDKDKIFYQDRKNR